VALRGGAAGPDPHHRLTLGEGFTPLLPAPRLARRLGVRAALAQGRRPEPDGSFKARGLALAVARAGSWGRREVALPSAGNAGSAAAAYAAAAGMPCHVVVPRDTPRVIIEETRALGADVELIDGLITDAGARVAEGVAAARLVRPVHAEGAVPRGGQEDHGLRAVRAAGRPPAGRHHLPDGRRHRPGRDVEGVRRDGAARLDRCATAAHDLGAGRRLRADRPGVGDGAATPSRGRTRTRTRRACACRAPWATS
jgi:hypothetical protein